MGSGPMGGVWVSLPHGWIATGLPLPEWTFCFSFKLIKLMQNLFYNLFGLWEIVKAGSARPILQMGNQRPLERG